MQVNFMALLIFATIVAIPFLLIEKITAAKPAATATTCCPLPAADKTLVAYGSSDGNPVCEYHPTRSWGQAK